MILENIPLILSIIGFSAAVFGAFLGSLMVKRRANAEREVVSHLVRIAKAQSFDASGSNIHVSFLGKGNVESKLLEQEMEALKKILEEIESEHSALVLKAIEQPSIKGRRAYIDKLAREVRQGLQAV